MHNRNHSFHKLVELLLSGAKVSTLDALILCGVSNLTYKICRLRKRGFNIVSESVSYNKVVNRVNKYASLILPYEIQENDLVIREYWIDPNSSKKIKERSN